MVVIPVVISVVIAVVIHCWSKWKMQMLANKSIELRKLVHLSVRLYYASVLKNDFHAAYRSVYQFEQKQDGQMVEPINSRDRLRLNLRLEDAVQTEHEHR